MVAIAYCLTLLFPLVGCKSDRADIGEASKSSGGVYTTNMNVSDVDMKVSVYVDPKTKIQYLVTEKGGICPRYDSHNANKLRDY